jgi:hypothetical protein
MAADDAISLALGDASGAQLASCLSPAAIYLLYRFLCDFTEQEKQAPPRNMSLGGCGYPKARIEISYILPYNMEHIYYQIFCLDLSKSATTRSTYLRIARL